MRLSTLVGFLLCGLVFFTSSGEADAPRRVERPFPVGKTAILKDDKAVYTVEGRVRIPKGIQVTCLRGVRIRAKGKDPAVIEVEGALRFHGVREREVVLEKVFVEPCAKYDSIRMDMTVFRNGGGVRTPKGVAVAGRELFFELFDVTRGAVFDLVVSTGDVTVSSACFDGPASIRTVIPPGAKEDEVRVFVRGCIEDSRFKCTPHGGRVGFVGGLVVDGGKDVTIQLSRSGGELTAVRNWGFRLIFDGLKVNSNRLEITHEKPGFMRRAQVAKLDVYSKQVLVRAPPEKGVKDVLRMDRCWFGGTVDPKVVLATIVSDGADDPERNGARVVLPKVNKRPLELAGPRRQ